MPRNFDGFVLLHAADLDRLVAAGYTDGDQLVSPVVAPVPIAATIWAGVDGERAALQVRTVMKQRTVTGRLIPLGNGDSVSQDAIDDFVRCFTYRSYHAPVAEPRKPDWKPKKVGEGKDPKKERQARLEKFGFVKVTVTYPEKQLPLAATLRSTIVDDTLYIHRRDLIVWEEALLRFRPPMRELFSAIPPMPEQWVNGVLPVSLGFSVREEEEA
jgi:hypothetical protein